MVRHLRSLALLPIIGALAACTSLGGAPAPTPVASGPTVIVVTATPAPATAVPPTAVPPTAVPPTAVPPTAVPPTAVPATAVPPTAVPPTAVPQEPQGIVQRVEFAPGNVSANTEGAVVRGTRDRYILGARGGQYMHIALSSLENNAVFTVYGPDGAPLAGTEEGSDVSNWQGPLPATGDYVVSVGPTRGNATYRIKFTITEPPPPLGAGSITGRLNYPSDFIPAQLVYAVRVDEPSFFYLVQTKDGDSGYVLNGVRPGNYYLLAYPAFMPDGALRSAHTQYVRCGAQVGCEDHSLVQVEVFDGQTTGGVDITDWYTSDVIPNRPAGPPQG